MLSIETIFFFNLINNFKFSNVQYSNILLLFFQYRKRKMALKLNILLFYRAIGVQ